MNTIVILGAGQFGRTCSTLLNKTNLRLLAYGDNNVSLQGQYLSNIPVLSVEHAVAQKPDYIFIGVTDEIRTDALRTQAQNAGFQGEFLLLCQLYQTFDIRSATLHRIAERLNRQHIPGAVAELGVYRGDLAWQLNALFPDRRLYLFDTFEGFDLRDIAKETELGCSRAEKQEFADTNMELVRSRLPYPDQAIFRTQRRGLSRNVMHLSAWMPIFMRLFWPAWSISIRGCHPEVPFCSTITTTSGSAEPLWP